jgi:hypothetical protein
MTHLEDPVKQPLTFSGVPRSRSGTVTSTPGTALYSDAIYIGDAETISVVLQVTNVSGTTHALIKYQESWNYNPTTEVGDWHATKTTVVADLQTDDTEMPYALSPILAPYIRFEFSGAASNGAYKQARGVLFKQ